MKTTDGAARKGKNVVADVGIFYDYTRVLSYDALFAGVIGARGMGKTYGAKKLVIRDYLKTGAQFIYLRRFRTELKGIDSFFTDVSVEFPDWELRVLGHRAQIRASGSDDAWQDMGYFIALSNAASKKSIAYPRVKRIVYDEFLLAKGFVRYLPNEYNALLEFVNTVDRYQDRVNVLLLANGVDIANPYFLEWNIQPHQGRIQKYHKGLIVFDFPDSLDYAEYAKQSKLGRLIAGTDYERYAIGNEFITGATTLIGAKPPECEYMFTLEHAGYTMTFWNHPSLPFWYATTRRVREPNVYTLSVRDGNENGYILEPTSTLLKRLKTAYRHRNVTFDSHQTHAAFQTVLAFLNTK